MAIVAVAALAFGAAEAPEDRATVEAITDLDGLRSAIPSASDTSRPFRMTMDVHIDSDGAGAQVPLGTSMVMRSDGQHSAMELTMLGRTISVVHARDIVYLPAVGGEGWVAYRMPDAGDGATAMLGTTDPLAMLDGWSSTHPVELVGEETIEGIDATHYRARNDIGGLLEDTASSQSQLDAFEQLGFSALPAMTIDAWIDTEGMLRRMNMRIEADQVTITAVMRINGVDEPVEITIPAGVEGPFDVDPTDPAGRFNTHLTD